MSKTKILLCMGLSLFLMQVFSFGATENVAHAATPELPINDSVYKDVSASQHYWWLNACFEIADIDKTTESEVDSWDFFEGDGNMPALGAMYGAANSKDQKDGLTGFRSCSDGNIVKTAFQYLGYSNSRDTFCSINGKQFDGDNVDKTTCIAGVGEGDWDNNADKNERAKWFRDNAASKKPPLTREGDFLRSYQSLIKGCSVKIVDDKLYDTAASVKDVNDDNKYAIPVFTQQDGSTNEKPKLVLKYVQGVGEGSKNSRIPLVSTQTGGVTYKTCNELANSARDNAGAYRAVIERLGVDSFEKTAPDAASDPTDDAGTACAIDGIGWIVCPVINALANIVDETYKVVESLLTVAPLTTDTSKSALYSAWDLMKNIANIAFVIGFLFIIYSQITGAGVTNYGIKKLLPKLIIAAILVNISFWVCAIAVDLSNVIGTSVKGLLDSATGNIDTPKFDAIDTGDGTWTSIAGPILAGAAVGIGIYLGLGSLLIALPAALLAIITAFLVLTARQAIIIVLIVISPLAFVAYLLPNTETWFKKWRGIFATMLLMFPAIALVFGASKLASQVIMSSATDGNEDGIFAVQMMGALVQIVPLAITPVIMKFAGGVLNRFGGIVNNPNKGPFDAMRKRAEATADRMKDNRDRRALDSNARWRNIPGLSRKRGLQSQMKREARKQERNAAYESLSNTDFRRDGKGAADYKSRGLDRQETANLQGEVLKNNVKEAHLMNNQGLYNRAYAAEDQVKNQQQESKNLYGRSDTGRVNAQATKTSSEEGKLVEQEHEQAYLRSAAGATHGQTKRLNDDTIKGLESDHETEYLESDPGKQARVRRVQAEKISGGAAKILEQEGETVYLQSDRGKEQQGTINVQAEGIAAANTDIKAVALGAAEGIAATVARDAADQRLKVTTKQAEKAALEQNSDLHINAQAAEDTMNAAQTEHDAVVSELRTDAAATAYSDQWSDEQKRVAQQLRDADIQKRAQTQRATFAGGVANVEYADKVTSSVDSRGNPISGGLADTAGGIDENGARRSVASAKAVVTKELMTNIENIQSTMPFDVSSNPKKLRQMFDSADSIEEKTAYLKAMYKNGSPGVDEARETLKTWTNDPGASQEKIQQIQELKEIMQSDQGFQRAGRDFEVWSNNEHSTDIPDPSDPTKTIKAPHASFGDVSADKSVWKSISAQRFASMNQSSQKQAFNLLDEAERDALIDRIYADTTARGQIKEGPLDVVKESRLRRGLEFKE